MAESYNLSSEDEFIVSLERNRAIEMIMNNYGNDIKRVIFTYVKNEADTDDIAQEVFVTVYQRLDSFQGKSSLRSWLYSIAVNKSKDHLRSWQVRNRNLLERMTREKRVDKSQYESPESRLVQNTENRQLIKQIMNLPLKYREVIILFYFNDFSTREISEILQAKDATIRTRLRRARGRLKANLEKEGK